MKNMYLKWIGLVLGAAIFFTGCGNSDSADNTEENVTTGIVSGSFYEGATVCFDTNSDGSCAGEENVTSDEKGIFVLKTKDADIIVNIPKGAIKHEEIGDSGEIVENNMTFAIPKEAIATAQREADGKIIISGISTLLYYYMKQNPDKNIDDAMAYVSNIVGVSEDDLLKDFNSNDINTTVKETLLTKTDEVEENIVNQSVNIFNINAPVFTSANTVSVPENQTGAITLKATDEDGDTLTYSISGGDSGDFDINSSSGVVTFKTAPDYESKNTYTFTAQVSDGEHNTTQDVTVNVAEVTNSATFLDFTS